MLNSCESLMTTGSHRLVVIIQGFRLFQVYNSKLHQVRYQWLLGHRSVNILMPELELPA